MPRVPLVANTRKLIATGAEVAPAVYGAPSREGNGVLLKVPTSGAKLDVDHNTPALAVGGGLEVEPGETYSATLAVGEKLYAISATNQTVQVVISGRPE